MLLLLSLPSNECTYMITLSLAAGAATRVAAVRGARRRDA